ncbi:MAG: ABC transporter substrate-binding protein [Desulfonatronovibrionaceae bacterium]
MPNHCQKFFLAFFILLFGLLPACSGEQDREKETADTSRESGPQKEPYKIGAVLRLSKGASDGVPARVGTELAVDMINSAGGINGRELKIVYYDSKDDATTAVNAVQKLISVDEVQAVIGPMMSGNVLAAAPLCQRSEVVMITPTGTSPKITGAGDYIFRVCSRIDLQAKALVKKALEMSGDERPEVAIIYSNEPYGKGCRKLFVKYLEQEGISPQAVESFQRGDKDFQAQLTKIKSLDPDILFIPGYLQETAPLVSQARQMGIDALSVGVFGDMAPLYVELAGKAAEDHLIAGEYDKDYETQINSEFKSAYEQKLRDNPNLPDNIMFASLAFDSVRMLAEAFQEGAQTGPQIKGYLDELENFDGVTGTLSFDSNGDIEKGGVYLFQVKEEKYEKIN